MKMDDACIVTQEGEALSEFDSPRNWYVLYTRPRWEKKVDLYLKDGGFESWCPLNKVERKWSDRRKIVNEPLFKSYVFVRVDADKLYAPLNVPGVLRYILLHKKPAIVRNDDIETVRRFLNLHQKVRVEQIPATNPGDAVKITAGPFMDHAGTVLEVRRSAARVLLHTLGFALVADIHHTDMEPVSRMPETAIPLL